MAEYHDISIELLRQLVSYDPETGHLTWLVRTEETNQGRGGAALARANKRMAGKPAFITPHKDGYLAGAIFGRSVMTHRVAWAIFHGEWPVGHIDHINGKPADNRIVNLRVVTRSQNQRNRKLSKANSSGYSGVFMAPHSCNWHAQISVEGKRVRLGIFRNFDDAVRARREAEEKFGYHKNHGRR